MPKETAMEAWKKKRRTEYLEQKEFRYYIFCEGQQTEPQYFNGFKKYIESNPIYKDMVLIEIEPCGAETMRVIGQAEDYVRKNRITKGQIWCVYDKAAGMVFLENVVMLLFWMFIGMQVMNLLTGMKEANLS